jgi:1-acyl-sn-glycerol-3-phosphate acyltransferase
MLLWMNTHLTQESSGDRHRVISFLMAREYYEQKNVIGWICRSLRSIPVDRDGRDMSAVKEALNRLRHGELIGIFPEGRLNTGEGLLPANPGIALLALRAKVPVYPVFIHNAPAGGNSMVAPFMRICRVRVTYGDPIDLSPWHGRRKDRATLSEVTTVMMRELARLGGTTFAPPADPDAEGTGLPVEGAGAMPSEPASERRPDDSHSNGSQTSRHSDSAVRH